MGKICAIFVNGFLQHCPIMCWSRNPRSNKCEATIKVTYGQYILSFFISPIDILANLTERYDNFDMCSIYCPYCIVEERSWPMLGDFRVDRTECGVLGCNYIFGKLGQTRQDKTWLNLRLTVSTRKRGARRCHASWTWPFVENLWLINY